MFNTLAYYLGYGDENEAPQQADPRLEDTPASDFNITTEEDGWDLVEKVLMKQRRRNSTCSTDDEEDTSGRQLPQPTPPPSPPRSEASWIVTPPSCFDAEIDRIGLSVFEHYERENLMIEHPSIFVPNMEVRSESVALSTIEDENTNPTSDADQEVANRATGPAKRAQRRASRQMFKSKAQQKKRSSVQKPLKQKSQNRNFNKMRLIVQQPRKHY